MTTVSDEQRQVCDRFQAMWEPPSAGSKVGIALQTIGLQPLNAMRHPPAGSTSGWYIWWGDTLNEDPDFFEPLHVEHLPERCPEALAYMALPPGWRIQLAPGHEDVWYDAKLLEV